MDQQTLLTKKERKELKRQEKNDAQRQSEQGRKLKRILKWAIVVILVIAVVYGLVFLLRQGQQPQLGEAFTIQGREHIAVGASHAAYNSNPPTSGPHYEQPSRWGVSQAELPDEQLIHNLEHGGIWISYIGIDDSTKSALEKIANSKSKVIVEPRAKNDAPIALASWGRLLKLEKFDEQTILNFIKSNKNQSPEPFAQ